MKKIQLLAILSLFFSLSICAQLKVNSSGYVGVGTIGYQQSPLTINHDGDSNYAVACNGDKGGILCEVDGNSSTTTFGGRFIFNATAPRYYSIGLSGEASVSPSSGNMHTAIGVRGKAGYGSSRNVGVLGTLGSCSKGVGIFGTVNSSNGPTLSSGEYYAGYFDGDTKVDGDLTVTGSIDGVLLGRSSSCMLGTTEDPSRSEAASTVSSRLAGMYATQYQVSKRERQCTAEEDGIEGDELMGDNEMRERKENIVEEQYHSKSHYALSAEQLEESFPDLVYEQADGTKGINYIEMIPLLVQSISELNARIAVLEEENASLSRSAASTETRLGSPTANSAKLFQNSPNPFRERTVIRFMLPEDAVNAYIYIFDMTGKTIKQIPVAPGQQSVTIQGYELTSGIYLYSLVVNGQEIDTKRMVITK